MFWPTSRALFVVQYRRNCAVDVDVVAVAHLNHHNLSVKRVYVPMELAVRDHWARFAAEI